MRRVKVKKIISVIVTFIMTLVLMTPLAFAETNDKNIVQPDGIIYEETYYYSDHNSIPHQVTADINGDYVTFGTIWHFVSYSWEETWALDQFGNRLYLVNQTPKVITSGDYSCELWFLDRVEEELAPDGSYYNTRVMLKYVEPITGISYGIVRPIYTYARYL